MKITFIGADHEVTGSCHMIEACGKIFLLDCGMEQGADTYVNQDIPVNPAEIDYVFLSHAHIDHSGLIPLLYKRGFRGEIHTTYATYDLCQIMLRDSAHIQESEYEWKSRKGKRAGNKVKEPIYTMADAEGSLQRFTGHKYDEKINICNGIDIRFTDIGHLLGSSSIEIWMNENGISKKLVFSGDIGNINQPIINDPAFTEEADFAIVESTYGDRFHDLPPDYISSLAPILQETFDRGGNVVIPAFAVGRTQEMLYFLRQIKTQGLIKNHEDFPVYVDSPLAIEAIKIFNENVETCFDDEAIELVRKGIDPISFPGLRVAISSTQSQEINFDDRPKVILSASGMCEAGRIRHHLKHNLWRPESTILFVGYQSAGSLGRIVLDGAKEVKLFGETISVKANVTNIPGMSGHADKNGLIKWVNYFKNKPQKLFVVHGETNVVEDFAKCLREEHGHDTFCPYSGSEYDLIENKPLNDIKPVVIEKKTNNISDKNVSKPITELNSAVNRLQKLVADNSKTDNAYIRKLTDLINDLCDNAAR